MIDHFNHIPFSRSSLCHQDPCFHLDLSSVSPARLSRSPFLRDPYEQYFVRVSRSKFPDAGEGLFAITDILEGTVIAFYNGVRIGSKNINVKTLFFSLKYFCSIF